MNPFATPCLPLDPLRVESDPAFNFVIVYQDFETGKQAKRVADFLTEQLKDERAFATQMWKFDVLGIAKLREMAAKDAAAADMVIISCHAGSQLPPEVRAWIDLWLAENNRAIALVGLVAEAAGSPTQAAVLRQYLADIAVRGGMEFFAQSDDVDQLQAATLSPSQGKGQPIHLVAASLADAARNAHPRWGINE